MRLHDEDLNVVFHLVAQNTQLFYGLSRAFRLERVLARVCSRGAFSPLSLLARARARFIRIRSRDNLQLAKQSCLLCIRRRNCAIRGGPVKKKFVLARWLSSRAREREGEIDSASSCIRRLYQSDTLSRSRCSLSVKISAL